MIQPFLRCAVLLVVLFARSATAQDLRFSVGPDVPSISTSGSAEVLVVPDRVEIAIAVEKVGTNLPKAKADADAVVGRVLAAAKERKIDPARMQTDFLSVDPEYSDEKGKPPVTYTVRRSIVVESEDIPGFEALISAVLAAGANHLHSIQFKTSRLREHRDEARKLATRAALEKAQLLAASLGRTVGKVRHISEGADSWMSSYNSWGTSQSTAMQNVAFSAPATQPEATMAPGRISVAASVNVTFELE